MIVATDRLDHVESVALGTWVDVGARNETPDINGISHMLEHMAFKGTRRRSALQISEEIEAVGGQMNAYTRARTRPIIARSCTKIRNWRLM